MNKLLVVLVLLAVSGCARQPTAPEARGSGYSPGSSFSGGEVSVAKSLPWKRPSRPAEEIDEPPPGGGGASQWLMSLSPGEFYNGVFPPWYSATVRIDGPQTLAKDSLVAILHWRSVYGAVGYTGGGSGPHWGSVYPDWPESLYPNATEGVGHRWPAWDDSPATDTSGYIGFSLTHPNLTPYTGGNGKWFQVRFLTQGYGAPGSGLVRLTLKEMVRVQPLGLLFPGTYRSPSATTASGAPIPVVLGRDTVTLRVQQ